MMHKKNYSNNAYVTLVATDDYAYGAIGLNESLKKVQSKYPLIILATDQISLNTLQLFNQFNIAYKIVPHLEFNKQHPTKRYRLTRSKIQLLTLIEFDKVCFLDADVIVIKNFDFLFEKDYFFLYRQDDGETKKWMISGGMFIIQPNLDFYKKVYLMSYFYSEDEQLWTYFYPYKFGVPLERDFEFKYFLHYRHEKYWVTNNYNWNSIKNYLTQVFIKYNS